MNRLIHSTFAFAASLVVLTSCDKMLEYDPGDVIIAEDALRTPDDAQRLLNSNYDVLANLYNGRVQAVAELMTDNLSLPNNNNDLTSVYNRETNFFTGYTNGVYTDFYRAIYRGNVLLENFDLIEGLGEAERTRMEAEVRFIRALCHWQVVKLWAQPYGYTADNSHLGIPVREEASQTPLPRATVAEVYDAILADLEFARNNLPADNGNYANRYAAFALSAHVAFVMNDLGSTITFANEVINSGAFQLEATIDRYPSGVVNPETIFGIVSSLIDNRSTAFRDLFRSDNNPSPTLIFSPDVASLLGQNPSDTRNEWYTQSGGNTLVARFNEKEFFNIPVLHLTGLMLIRAEALARDGQPLDDAIANINAIRQRAFGEGINQLPADADAAEVTEAARLELRKETLCEGTWVDHVKRLGTLGEPSTVRGASWDCPGMALQFPNGETSAAGFILNPEGGCL
jgi:hypothetical protein